MKNKMKRILNNFIFIYQFAIDDFRNKYAGAGLGIAWAFLQPVITIVLYWFIFQLGFKSQPVDDFPFILWLMSGLIPWFFISDSITSATTSMVEYSYLVKKVLFNIDILPAVKVASTLIVQVTLVIFTVFFYALWGFNPGLHLLKLIIYMVYSCLLVIGFAYLTSTLYVFFRDTTQIVSIILQVIFWMTPIVWEFGIMPEKVQQILLFNPLYYVINGYRSVLIDRNFAEISLYMQLYYWGVACVILLIGKKLFNKCKKHFADVL